MYIYILIATFTCTVMSRQYSLSMLHVQLWVASTPCPRYMYSYESPVLLVLVTCTVMSRQYSLSSLHVQLWVASTPWPRYMYSYELPVLVFLVHPEWSTLNKFYFMFLIMENVSNIGHSTDLERKKKKPSPWYACMWLNNTFLYKWSTGVIGLFHGYVSDTHRIAKTGKLHIRDRILKTTSWSKIEQEIKPKCIITWFINHWLITSNL